MHHQLEATATRESNGGEVTHVAGREPADVDRFRQGDDGGIDEAQAKIREAPVHLHRACELTSRRWRVREGTCGEIPHERMHRGTLVPQEVVDFREHETGDVARASPVDGAAEQLVVGRGLDEVLDERPGVADERRRATGRHGTARARRRDPSGFGRWQRFAAWDAAGTVRAPTRGAVERTPRARRHARARRARGAGRPRGREQSWSPSFSQVP